MIDKINKKLNHILEKNQNKFLQKIVKIINYFFNIIFFSKKIFRLPKKKKVLIFNGDNSELILKALTNIEADVIYNRFFRAAENKAKINFFILFYNFLHFKFSLFEYAKTYIKFCQPKVIITFIDNDINFYKLKKEFPIIKFVTIQASMRTTQGDLFENVEYLKKKNYESDYILTFNNFFGDYYQKFLTGKVIKIGSFKSNSIRITKNKKKKYDILFVSSYKGNKDSDFYLKKYNIKYQDIRKYDEKIFFFLKKILIQNPQIKLGILGCKTRSILEEKKYFFNYFKNLNYKFIPQSINRNTYGIIDQVNLLLAIDSSLIYESIARGNKICVFGNRGFNYPLNSSKFGWPAKIKSSGYFWATNYNYSTFKKIILRNLKISKKNYFLKYDKKFYTDLAIYDYKNSIFRKLINKIIL